MALNAKNELILEVEVACGRGLMGRNIDRWPHPYIQLQMGSERGSTSTLLAECYPIWHERFHFLVNEQSVLTPLLVSCWDNRGLYQKLLGRFEIRLPEVSIESLQSRSSIVFELKDAELREPKGEIALRLVLQDPLKPDTTLMEMAKKLDQLIPSSSMVSRQSSDGPEDRYRTHNLYNRSANSDGLYTCPFAGDLYGHLYEHKPTKLKSTYE